MIRTISDSEKLALMEKRWGQLKVWLKNEAAKRRNDKKPEPHPLDFMLSSDEEANDAREAVYRHNSHLEQSAAAIEYVLEAIENTERRDLAVIHPQLDFSI